MATLPTINAVVADRPRAHDSVPTGLGQRFYRPELDALRFAAFLLVFIHHGLYRFSPFCSRFGAFGLSLFFLLSAYLITELLQREKALAGTVDVRAFYIRRTLRIWPLYYGFLCLTLLLGVWFPGHRGPWLFIASFVLMVGNIYVGERGFPNNSASFLWSISVEEQFYLAWPLLNRNCSRRCLMWIALAAYPASAVATVLLALRPEASNLSIWANPIVEFQMFAWGVLLALLLEQRRATGGRRILFLLAGIALWSAAARWCGIDDRRLPSIPALLAGYPLVGAGCAAIFLSIYGIQGRRMPEFLVYLGKRSYGLYVFHELCLEAAAWLLNRDPATASATHHIVFGIAHITLGLLFAVVLAVASYRYFETPFLKIKDRFAVVRSRTV